MIMEKLPELKVNIFLNIYTSDEQGWFGITS